MRLGRIVSCLCLLACLAANSVQAGSPVWKIAKGDRYLFIGGTIHVLAPSDYPLPAAFETAYKQSDKLVFEADILKAQTPEFQNSLMAKVVYSDGRNLKTVLNQETFQQLEQHFSNRGIPIKALMNFKPGMVMMTLTAIELKRLGLTGQGVDEFYSVKAVNDGKLTGHLETMDQQLNFIADMGSGWENELVSYTLRDMKNLPEIMQTLKDAWRRGDNNKLKETALTPLKNDYPDVHKRLIVQRNQSWMPKIEAMLKTREVELILVGALHLVGEEGLLRKLAALGYSVEQP